MDGLAADAVALGDSVTVSPSRMISMTALKRGSPL
jgi:hypothetical protein